MVSNGIHLVILKDSPFSLENRAKSSMSTGCNIECPKNFLLTNASIVEMVENKPKLITYL